MVWEQKSNIKHTLIMLIKSHILSKFSDCFQDAVSVRFEALDLGRHYRLNIFGSGMYCDYKYGHVEFHKKRNQHWTHNEIEKWYNLVGQGRYHSGSDSHILTTCGNDSLVCIIRKAYFNEASVLICMHLQYMRLASVLAGRSTLLINCVIRLQITHVLII